MPDSLFIKQTCHDDVEFHMICPEREDLLVKGQCLVVALLILLVLCKRPWAQLGLRESAPEILASWVFEPMENKGQVLDCPEFLNSLPFCDEVFSCQLVSRKYSDIIL